MNYNSKLPKPRIFILFSLILSMSCGVDQKKADDNTKVQDDQEMTTPAETVFPEDLAKVFDAHGGFENWQKMKSLSFSMKRPNGIEVITTDLQSRSELIDHPQFMIGYNGETLWVLNKSEEPYEGNARFYKGLMFYFYAMPFVLGDSGVNYSEAEPLEFEVESYPGIRISYDIGVGESPDDEYILYFNRETYQMEWLAYTVTFGKEGKSDDFHFIRYKYWQNINGLKLPVSVSWYTYEDHVPQELRNSIIFDEVSLTEERPDSGMFNPPDGALVVD